MPFLSRADGTNSLIDLLKESGCVGDGGPIVPLHYVRKPKRSRLRLPQLRRTRLRANLQELERGREDGEIGVKRDPIRFAHLERRESVLALKPGEFALDRCAATEDVSLP